MDSLLSQLVTAAEHHRYFDALALKARIDLGLPPVLSTENVEFSGNQRTAYEERLTQACREVGARLLKSGDFAGAYHYLGTIGELEPLRTAIEHYDIAADEAADNEARIGAVVELALGQAVHPRKGLEIILKRAGTCQAITACQGVVMQDPRSEVREDCAKLMIRRIHGELLERVRAEIAHVEKCDPPTDSSISALIKGRDWLFENDNYHLDTSHLNSVVRFARLLSDGDEARLAIEICDYGRRLSERYRYGEPAPFDDVYNDTMIYLKGIVGVDVENAIDHFRSKAESAKLDEGELYPAEVLVNLLVKLGRDDDAIAFAGRVLNPLNGGAGLSCPSVNELCRRSGRYDRLAEFAKKRGDLVSYMAGIIAAAQ